MPEAENNEPVADIPPSKRVERDAVRPRRLHVRHFSLPPALAVQVRQVLGRGEGMFDFACAAIEAAIERRRNEPPQPRRRMGRPRGPNWLARKRATPDRDAATDSARMQASVEPSTG